MKRRRGRVPGTKRQAPPPPPPRRLFPRTDYRDPFDGHDPATCEGRNCHLCYFSDFGANMRKVRASMARYA